MSVMVVLVGVAGLSGCAYDYAAERSFGQSVTLAIREQSVRPDGVGYDGIALGLEGSAAKGVMDRYYRSYEFPQSIGNVLNLGVGIGTMPATATGAMPMTAPMTGVGGR